MIIFVHGSRQEASRSICCGTTGSRQSIRAASSSVSFTHEQLLKIIPLLSQVSTVLASVGVLDPPENSQEVLPTVSLHFLPFLCARTQATYDDITIL